MKAIHFTDQNYYELTLTRGNYLIDGEAIHVESTSSYRVESLDDIRRVSINTIISKYSNGEVTISKEDYLNRKNKLNPNEGEFDTLEEEYEYKKFLQLWSPIYMDVETISEPITVPKVITSLVDTGNKFVVGTMYNNQLTDSFTYNRIAACTDIITKKFDSLGFVFKGDVNYGETKNQKIWGNSTHSGLRYVTAFGGYLLNDSWKVNSTRGTIDKCLTQYEADKKDLEKIIQLQYDLNYGQVNLDRDIIKELHTNLTQLLGNIRSIDYKKSGYSNWSFSIKKAQTTISIVEKLIK